MGNGSKIISLHPAGDDDTSDPPTLAGVLQVYCKIVAGSCQLFYKDSSGTIHALGASSSVMDLIETMVIGANTNAAFFTGLSGDTDANYLLIGDLFCGPGGADVLQVATDLSGHEQSLLVSATPLAPSADQKIADITSGQWYHLEVKFCAKSGAVRQGWGRSTSFVFGTGITWQEYAIGNDDVATVISAFGLGVSGAHGIGAGSRFSLYRIKDA
jgi:hypothetical protein